MKKVILLAVVAMFTATACQGEPNLDSIPVMEYGDCEMEGITFYFDGVIDMIYAPEEQKYYIEYMDPDVFDEDNVGDYITIVTSKVTFFEVLADLEKSREEQVDMEINRKWVILPRDLAPGYQLENAEVVMNKDDFRTTIIAIFVMAMCFAAAFCCSCSSNERNHPSIISSAQYCEQQGAEEVYPFNFLKVDDALYSSEDFAFFLEYGDSTTFNYDELAKITGRDHWYGEFIIIDVYDSLVSEFLEDFGDFYYEYKVEGNLPKCNQLNNKYAIVQYNAEGDFLWILEKVPENFKW